MPDIASILGIQWEHDPDAARGYTLTHQAKKQATAKGLDHADIMSAANDPTHTYENSRVAGQVHHVRGPYVAVVNPAKKQIVTAYLNTEQKEQHAQRSTSPRKR